MPTYELAARCRRDFRSLTGEQKRTFKAALADFIADLKTAEKSKRPPRFRRGLRVKALVGSTDIYEMTWAPDGRATFQFGEVLKKGQRHVIWRRVGTHDVFRNP